MEVLDTLLDNREVNAFAPVLEKYTSIPDLEDKENWYEVVLC